MAHNYLLTIGWLYPDLMSTYGDRGNIITLEKRCRWRGLGAKIVSLGVECGRKEIEECDLILGGGAQDRQQEIVINDLLKKKDIFRKVFDKNIPGLFVCGSPQLLGHYYVVGDGKKLAGLGIFDFVTRHFGHDKPRCIGNTVGMFLCHPERSEGSRRDSSAFSLRMTYERKTIVGFENHGGRTYLGKKCQPFAKVIKGYGNNGEDGFEGAVYRNVIACYYHGPFLPKNPHIADWLTTKALEVKYKETVKLKKLDDDLEWKAHDFMLKKMGVII